MSDVPANTWNALQGTDTPFLSHEFLAALEDHACLQPWGWQPCHVLVYDNKDLVGAMPLYLKDNSYGEFVFDWAWADAYQRNGLNYYPKLVSAIPYTPVTSSRLLCLRQADRALIEKLLIDAALAHAEALHCSSLHVLFPPNAEMQVLENNNLMRRIDCQFHWSNENYQDFDDFLGKLTSKRRKMIKRERRLAYDSGVKIKILDGHTASAEDWQAFHRFYTTTFERKSGYATLTQDFFTEIARTLPDAIVLVIATLDNEPIAGAFNMRSADTLYGRHWGCSQQIRGLHFEVCYYLLIEYCIRNGLKRYEAGAQGEHKIQRGFLPYQTQSAHWISDSGFRVAVDDFLHRERRMIDDYISNLADHSPFRKTTAAT